MFLHRRVIVFMILSSTVKHLCDILRKTNYLITKTDQQAYYVKFHFKKKNASQFNSLISLQNFCTWEGWEEPEE